MVHITLILWVPRSAIFGGSRTKQFSKLLLIQSSLAPAENRRVLRAFLADYGPTLGLGGMDQAAPDLPGGSDDSKSAEDERHNAS